MWKERFLLYLWRKIFEQRPGENDEASDEAIWRKTVPGRRHSRCKGPEIEASVVCLKS